jgi:hypothetical protein
MKTVRYDELTEEKRRAADTIFGPTKHPEAWDLVVNEHGGIVARRPRQREKRRPHEVRGSGPSTNCMGGW